MGVVWESCQTITWYCWILDNGSKRQKSFNHTLANFQNCTSDLQKLHFRLQKLPKCDWNVVFFAFYCHCPRSSNIKVWSLLVHVWAYITRQTWVLCDAILDQTAIKCDRILDQTAIKCDRSFCGVMPLWAETWWFIWIWQLWKCCSGRRHWSVLIWWFYNGWHGCCIHWIIPSADLMSLTHCSVVQFHPEWYCTHLFHNLSRHPLFLHPYHIAKCKFFHPLKSFAIKLCHHELASTALLVVDSGTHTRP